MKPLPFQMKQDTDLEKWRADTFWQKEPETIAWIDSFESGCVFYDVGANVGVYSLYLASRDINASIYAFEPQQSNYKALCENISLNRFQNIHPRCAAISKSSGLCFFREKFTTAGATGGQIDGTASELQTVAVRKYAIDDLDQPDYVKIDIDGLEFDVVVGMIRTLLSVKSVLIEIGSERGYIDRIMHMAGLCPDARFNDMKPHSRERRQREKIPEENVVYTRRDV